MKTTAKTNTFKSIVATVLVSALTLTSTAIAPAQAGNNNAKKFVTGLVIGAAVAAALSNRKGYSGLKRHQRKTYRRYKKNKYGFTTEKVWKRKGCKSLQRKCDNGSRHACYRYEDRCQIN